MAWRGSTNIQDRIFSVLVYLFAIYDSLMFGEFLFPKFPVFLKLILIYAVYPINFLYDTLGNVVGRFASLLIFFVLYLAVVNNVQIKHFIRYNTLQTILIGILLSLIGLIIQWVLEPIFGGNNILIVTLYNTTFLGSLVACIYAMIQSARGIYAEIPIISEAAYSQLR